MTKSITKVGILQKGNVQLQVKLLALESDAVRAEAWPGKFEQQVEAVRQVKENLCAESQGSRARTQSLKLTYDDLRNKFGKIHQRARQKFPSFAYP